jgi:hypothetical protein
VRETETLVIREGEPSEVRKAETSFCNPEYATKEIKNVISCSRAFVYYPKIVDLGF